MKMLFIMHILLFFLSITLQAEDFREYPFTKVKVIQTGPEEGMIGWEPAIAGGYSGPRSFAISQGGKIYVPDRVNKRLDIFDRDFNSIKCIYVQYDENAAYYTPVMKMDSSGNILVFGRSSLKKIDPDGKDIFSIQWADLPKIVFNHKSIFPLGDDVFFYNDQNYIQYISKDGEIESTKKAMERLKEIAQEENRISSKLAVIQALPDSQRKIFYNLEKSPRYLLLSGRFYASEFYFAKQYFDKVREIREYYRTTLKKQEQKNLASESLGNVVSLLDYDSDNNSYWITRRSEASGGIRYGILIYSSFGELLEGFYYSRYDENGGTDLKTYPTSGAAVAIAPNGDVYFMVGNKTNYTIYKAERKW